MPVVTESTPPTYRLTEEQALLRDAVRVIADERVAPRAAEIDRTGEFPQDLRQLLAAQDILALPFPVEHGGLGGELLSLCLAIEQLSRACATTGLILAVQELGSLPLLLGGTPEQQARWVPRLASGEQLIAFALTEAEAGSDVAAIRTQAVRDGDDYLLTGSKRFISHGSVADLITVFAVTDPGPDTSRHERLSCFIVEVPTDGFAVGSAVRIYLRPEDRHIEGNLDVTRYLHRGHSLISFCLLSSFSRWLVLGRSHRLGLSAPLEASHPRYTRFGHCCFSAFTRIWSTRRAQALQTERGHPRGAQPARRQVRWRLSPR
jgi:hypothetical protein